MCAKESETHIKDSLTIMSRLMTKVLISCRKKAWEYGWRTSPAQAERTDPGTEGHHNLKNKN
jgi:hypothetical protein